MDPTRRPPLLEVTERQPILDVTTHYPASRWDEPGTIISLILFIVIPIVVIIAIVALCTLLCRRLRRKRERQNLESRTRTVSGRPTAVVVEDRKYDTKIGGPHVGGLTHSGPFIGHDNPAHTSQNATTVREVY